MQIHGSATYREYLSQLSGRQISGTGAHNRPTQHRRTFHNEITRSS